MALPEYLRGIEVGPPAIDRVTAQGSSFVKTVHKRFILGPLQEAKRGTPTLYMKRFIQRDRLNPREY